MDPNLDQCFTHILIFTKKTMKLIVTLCNCVEHWSKVKENNCDYKNNKWSLTTRVLSVNRIDLQAPTLVGPPWANLSISSASHDDNRGSDPGKGRLLSWIKSYSKFYLENINKWKDYLFTLLAKLWRCLCIKGVDFLTISSIGSTKFLAEDDQLSSLQTRLEQLFKKYKLFCNFCLVWECSIPKSGMTNNRMEKKNLFIYTHEKSCWCIFRTAFGFAPKR